MEEIAERSQLYSPVMIRLVLRLAGVKVCCCPVVNVGRGRKPQHPIWKLKIIGICYLGRTPTSCLQKVSSCLAPRSYPNERQTLHSCQEVFWWCHSALDYKQLLWCWDPSQILPGLLSEKALLGCSLLENLPAYACLGYLLCSAKRESSRCKSWYCSPQPGVVRLDLQKSPQVSGDLASRLPFLSACVHPGGAFLPLELLLLPLHLQHVWPSPAAGQRSLPGQWKQLLESAAHRTKGLHVSSCALASPCLWCWQACCAWTAGWYKLRWVAPRSHCHRAGVPGSWVVTGCHPVGCPEKEFELHLGDFWNWVFGVLLCAGVKRDPLDWQGTPGRSHKQCPPADSSLSSVACRSTASAPVGSRGSK